MSVGGSVGHLDCQGFVWQLMEGGEGRWEVGKQETTVLVPDCSSAVRNWYGRGNFWPESGNHIDTIWVNTASVSPQLVFHFNPRDESINSRKIVEE